ncbi:MAG TPA: thiamine pyrophosphate-binding protein [Candidatus Methylomirabilis sp.]|jgi:sulfopyruvate decarboxylase alpha subunit
MTAGVTPPEGARRIAAGLLAARVEVVASVPDTWIGRLVEAAGQLSGLRTVAACREEEAIAIACGANLAGRRGAALMQNAGLLNCGGILGSLVQLYRVPLFMIVSYRGDARDPIYYHAPKGRHTEPFLRALGIPYALADRRADLEAQVRRGVEHAEEASGAFVLLIGGEDLE